MATRRRICLLAFVLVCVTVVVYFEPTYCVRGWLHGEAFFDGRPTSYWRNIIENDLHSDQEIFFGRAPPKLPSWPGRFVRWLGYIPKASSSLQLVKEDQAADVLTQLVNDSDATIAAFANDVQDFRTTKFFRSTLSGDVPKVMGWMAIVTKHHRIRPDSKYFDDLPMN